MVDSKKQVWDIIENNPKETLLISITITCWILMNVPLVTIPNELLQRIAATLAPPTSVTLTVVMVWLVYEEAGASSSATISKISNILETRWKGIRTLSGVIEVLLMVATAAAGMAVSTFTTIVFAAIASIIYMMYFVLVFISTIGICRDAIVKVSENHY